MQLHKPYGAEKLSISWEDNGSPKGNFERKLKLDERTPSRSGKSPAVVYPGGEAEVTKKKKEEKKKENCAVSLVLLERTKLKTKKLRHSNLFPSMILKHAV